MNLMHTPQKEKQKKRKRNPWRRNKQKLAFSNFIAEFAISSSFQWFFYQKKNTCFSFPTVANYQILSLNFN